MNQDLLQISCPDRCGNDFSVGGAKIGERQSRLSTSNYNFMQYVFFEKVVQLGLWLSPQRLGRIVLRIFVLKVR